MNYLEFFRENNDSMVDLLKELVVRESPTSDKAAVDALGEYIVDQLKHAGAQVEIFPRRNVGDIIYGAWNANLPGKPIVLLGHIDTVWPVGTLQDMPLWQRDIRLYGPGILDMKAGIALIIKTLDLLHLHGALPHRPIWVLFNTDEEKGSTESRELIEKVAANAGLALVFEPATLGETVKTSRRGTARYAVHIEGIPAHSGEEPEKGVNAIHEAAHHILAISSWNAPERGTNVAVNMISGGTAANIIAPSADFLVDMRFTQQTECDDLVAKITDLQARHDNIRLAVRGGVWRPPMERDAQMVRTFEQLADLAGKLGLPIGEELTGAGSDANFTAALGIPTLDGLGARGDGMHAEHEHVILTSLPRRAALLASVLHNWRMNGDSGA